MSDIVLLALVCTKTGPSQSGNVTTHSLIGLWVALSDLEAAKSYIRVGSAVTISLLSNSFFIVYEEYTTTHACPSPTVTRLTFPGLLARTQNS